MSVHRRVLVVTGHFWPHTTDQSLRLRSWTRCLVNEGYSPLVLTPRWNAAWPRRLTCEEVQVELLERPLGTRLLTKRYSRILIDRVTSELDKVEAIYCDAVDLDTEALLGHLPRGDRPPIIVRFDSPNLSGSNSLAATKQVQRAADICRKANAVIVTNAVAHQQLIAHGVQPSNIHRWAGFDILRVDRSTVSRSAARQILGDTNHELFLRGQDRLVVCPGELTEAWEIPLLLDALGPLVEQSRNMRLWILGDGPERGRIYEYLKHQGWHRTVVMPGCFTDLEHVLQAADLMVFPSADMGWQWLIPSCLANGIPVMVADGLHTRQFLGAAHEQLSFRTKVATDLHSKVRQWLRQPAGCWDGVLATAREHWTQQLARTTPFTSLAQLLHSRLSLPF